MFLYPICLSKRGEIRKMLIQSVRQAARKHSGPGVLPLSYRGLVGVKVA